MFGNLLRYKNLRKAAIIASGTTLSAFIAYKIIGRPFSTYFENLPRDYQHKIYSDKAPIPASKIPTRLDSLALLKSGEEFDLLVVGGGVTGSGVALDAATRGLKVALVEKDDFSSGTSSRSTKLIHGGVRYLEKAFKNFDISQFQLVSDALKERKHLLAISPNLSYDLPIIVPLYYNYPEFFFYAPYFWVGMKMYDMIAGSKGTLKKSFYMRQREVMEKFPMLNEKGLKGAIVYYDGMHNDSRMNLGIALTAATKGAAVTNHIELKDIVKNTKGKICGAVLQDHITGDKFKVKCKSIINATGCFSDGVRCIDSTQTKPKPIIEPSSGVHVVLSSCYSPAKVGMLIPNTDDGRVLFMLPWENSTLAGTTDSSCEIKENPSPTEKEVSFVMHELRKYLNSDISVKDINASWSGIRPLARDVSNSDTASISRDHVIEVMKNGLISISGGKWTTYRKMSEDVVDRLLQEHEELAVKAKPCVTKKVPLVGASGWSLALKQELLVQGVEEDVAEHLSHNYGFNAYEVADIGIQTNMNKRLAQAYPYIEAEVIYGCRHEYAMSLVDVVARRMRLAFINSEETREVLPRVLEIMATEKKWDNKKRAEEFLKATEFLDTMNVQSCKRHEWTKENTAKGTIEKVNKAFGESPLSERDVEALLKSGGKKSFEIDELLKMVRKESGKDISGGNVEVVEELLRGRRRKLFKVEDLIFTLSAAIIMNQ